MATPLQLPETGGRDFRGDRGASAIEYALVVTLISLAIILGATAFGIAVGDMFDVTF